MASATAELTWLSFLLQDIGVPLLDPPRLFFCNLFAFHMTVNLVFHSQTKHIQLDYHFVKRRLPKVLWLPAMFLQLHSLLTYLQSHYHVPLSFNCSPNLALALPRQVCRRLKMHSVSEDIICYFKFNCYLVILAIS